MKDNIKMKVSFSLYGNNFKMWLTEPYGATLAATN